MKNSLNPLQYEHSYIFELISLEGQTMGKATDFGK